MAQNEASNEGNIKTFNTSKLYADFILFPKMDMFQKYQHQADFGNERLQRSEFYTEEIREIERYNGLKGMTETVFNLLLNVSSTVRLKKRSGDIGFIDKMLADAEKLKKLFYNERERFFITKFTGIETTEVLDRAYFEKVRNAVEKIYINTEMLMTRHRLLFTDSEDEILNDKELIERIKTEYTI